MIDIKKIDKLFREYIKNYDKDAPGMNMKIVHTFSVVDNAKMIATKMNLSEEDTNLAILIAYLHDIGRFEELKQYKKFNSVANNHALYGSKVLFEEGLIRVFIEDNSFDPIIQKAIENHNKLSIEDGLNERELLHAKIIRDADKLDNFRMTRDESIENRYAGIFKTVEEFNNSLITDKVYTAIVNHECVVLKDRVYPLDYLLSTLAMVFDFNFKEALSIIKEKDFINILIDKYNYTNKTSKEQMENVRAIVNNYIDAVTNTNKD